MDNPEGIRWWQSEVMIGAYLTRIFGFVVAGAGLLGIALPPDVQSLIADPESVEQMAQALALIGGAVTTLVSWLVTYGRKNGGKPLTPLKENRK